MYIPVTFHNSKWGHNFFEYDIESNRDMFGGATHAWPRWFSSQNSCYYYTAIQFY